MVESERITILLACEDEAARSQVRKLLRARSDVEVIATCATGVEALRVLRQQPIDILFSDVRLPDLEVGELMEIAGPASRPAALVAFAAEETAAYPAVEAGAADFLRLPVSGERFAQAFERALLRLAVRASLARERSAAAPTAGADLRYQRRRGYPRRLVARVGESWKIVPVRSIEYVESDGNYSILHCGAKTLKVRSTIGFLEGQLDPEEYFRIHRSTIVRLDRVEELKHVDPGEYRIRLVDGVELELSRMRRDAFLAAIEGVDRVRLLDPV